MKDIAAVLIGVFFVIIIHFVGYHIIKDGNYIIPNSEWNCTKSLMIDEKNVDRVTCVEYRKVIDAE